MAKLTASAWNLLAKKNKIEKNVIFYNRFVDLENLKEFIGAADLYITPYLNEAQITSGNPGLHLWLGQSCGIDTLLACSELLADDRGVLVPFGDAPAIAREVSVCLRDDTRRHAMRKNAYRMGREMIWSQSRQYTCVLRVVAAQGAAASRKSLARKTLDQRPGNSRHRR